MASGSVRIDIPFDALVAALSSLNTDEKRRLMDMLDDQLLAEEGSPEEEAEVAEARAQIEAGEYVTLEDYLDGKRTP